MKEILREEGKTKSFIEAFLTELGTNGEVRSDDAKYELVIMMDGESPLIK